MTKRAYTIALLTLPAFALGACSKGGAANNVTSSNTSTSTTTSNSGATTTTESTTTTAGASGATMRPGEWEMKAELVDMSGPGIPPQALAAARQQMGSQPAHKSCVTQEQVDQMASQMVPNGGNCNFTDRQTANGVLAMRGTCQSPAGTVTMAMNGGYDAETMHADITTDTAAAQGTVHMALRLTGHRTGECDAASAGASASGNSAGGADKE